MTAFFDEVHPLGLYAIWCASENERQKDVIIQYIRIWRQTTPSITGHELKASGIPPGPIYREILGKLRNAWLDGDIASVEQEAVLVHQFIETYRDISRPNRRGKS